MTSRNVLVTGSNGLIGRAVVRRLRALEVDVIGVARRAVSSRGVVEADLTDATHATAVLKQISPSVIVHLAGAVTGDHGELYQANVVATRNLLEAVVKLDQAPAVIVAGSAAEYGDPITERVAEDHPTCPVTEYGRAKVEQSTVVRQIAGAAGLRFSIVRPFNIVSRELPATVALGNIRRQLLAASGPVRQVRCGRLDVVRDFIPLALVVETVVRLLELQEWPPILNVCSGVGIELGDLLEAMATALGVEVAVSPIAELAALPAAEKIIGDPSLLQSYDLWCEPTASSLARVMIGDVER
jgi:GDP-4-dehydro-6-deoxy-D-mannose reductase